MRDNGCVIACCFTIARNYLTRNDVFVDSELWQVPTGYRLKIDLNDLLK